MSKAAKYILGFIVALLIMILAVSFFLIQPLIESFQDIFTGGEKAELSEAQQTPPISAIDFAKGPVELIVSEGGKRWLVRDEQLVRKAAEIGIPDTTGAETTLLFLSILFLSPPANGPAYSSLIFTRDGETLASAGCVTSVCGKMPELRNLFDPLIAAGREILYESESFESYEKYLTAYKAAESSHDRWGAINPPKPEKKKRFSTRIYITSPVFYAKDPGPDWLKQKRQNYRNAFLTEYKDLTSRFDVKVSHETGSAMMLSRCSDNQPVYLKGDEYTLLFPSDWVFSVVVLEVSAEPELVEKMLRRSDWSFLPTYHNDNEAFSNDVSALVKAKGNKVDPENCYITDYAPGGSEVSVLYGYKYRYHFSWTKLRHESAP